MSGIRRDTKKFNSLEYTDTLANGDICLAVGTSEDSFRARDRAKEAENAVDIDYAIPKEGAPVLLDNLAILRDAPHVEEAYAFIDFLLRPAIAARNTNFTRLANSVPASKAVDRQNHFGQPVDLPRRRCHATALRSRKPRPGGTKADRS